MSQALHFIAPGRFEWRDQVQPRLAAATDAIVRPLAVARCDLDLYIATGVVPMKGPFAFGHECVAEVVDAGEAAGVQPGQRVVVPFQLSCGRCDSCRRGFTGSCDAYPPLANFGLGGAPRTDYGGALSGAMRVPFADHMLVPLPDGLDPVAVASASDNIADGWRAVGPQLAARPGASVLVVGGLAQSVGLYAAGCAVAAGAGRVLYLDDDADRRARAALLGAVAEPLALADGREAKEQFDIVVEAAGTPAALAFAMQSAGRNAVLTSVAIHLQPLTPVPLGQAYYKGLTLVTARVDSRAHLPAVVNCLACGHFHPEHVTHRMLSFSQAGEAMADPGPKLVFVA
ncbi:MAG: alcohol dehydrogenase catalytic domain-containing protein [Sphingomonadales bacterium]|jgi:alcohol dehydrogenase